MTASVDAMRQLFGPFKGDRANLLAFPEIYPGQKAPVLHREESELTYSLMTWGFPGPQAAKGRPVTNVRNLTSPFWRSALNNPERRCLVPVTRFCEWSQAPDPATGRKVKHWFGTGEAKGGEDPLFAFAGIWRPGGEENYMAFLTCAPNRIVGEVHPKAMPVMLAPRDHDRWLEGGFEDVEALAQPYPDTDMIQIS
ncbi:putative SOS response-associated peptidase YedK [Sphingomicrobium lutaoense]|uniref:Abasic site processing protein n=2 Tax=Sphingomicrobium lutaoense TaxID=515949 RepID=A0A839Z3I1_9SPHN|nr:putative SOS response-associated peptidase YedK [Sphingomicrobium lutaoense]